MKCPCCHRPMADFTLEHLKAMPLSPSRKSILNLLLDAGAAGARKEALIRRVYGNRDPKTVHNALNSHLSDMRAVLEPLGWTIPHQVSRWATDTHFYRLERLDETAS